MSSSILKQLIELKQVYRDQYFNFTPDQQQKYNDLLNSRREIVKNWYKNDQVATSSKTVVKEVISQ
tara:strand:+ start:549 stop:746 length:198 start_codon:yes stop_codon:yes gene_type:complete